MAGPPPPARRRGPCPSSSRAGARDSRKTPATSAPSAPSCSARSSRRYQSSSRVKTTTSSRAGAARKRSKNTTSGQVYFFIFVWAIKLTSCFVYRLTRLTRYSATAWARSSRTRCASRSKLEAGPTTGPGPSRRRCTCRGCARRRSAARLTTQTKRIRRCPNSTAPTSGPRLNVGTARTQTSTRTPRSRIGSFPNSKETLP